ncbi:MAG TPA: hypothetical protein VFP19_09425 [Candidatus Limnocylindrales bacterium]|nr:hypothetical protein [Candidatus Limnocylindrales bacterium]
MTLQLHRPDGKGGLEPNPVTEVDYRRQLRSPRWGAALSGGRMPQLKNPEMNPTSVARSLMLWVGLAGATFVIIVAGYVLGVWSFAG